MGVMYLDIDHPAVENILDDLMHEQVTNLI